MHTQVEKPKQNRGRAVSNNITQKKSNVKQGFGLVDNRPEAIAQRQSQGMAKKSVHPEPIVVQRMRDAGETPVIETRGPGVVNPGIRITGLNNCVGVVVRVYGPTMDYIAVAGGHFVTPTMYDFDTDGFTASGLAFIDAIQRLVAGYSPDDLEWVYHANTEDGPRVRSSVEALQVANAIKKVIGTGDVREGGGSFSESI